MKGKTTGSAAKAGKASWAGAMEWIRGKQRQGLIVLLAAAVIAVFCVSVRQHNLHQAQLAAEAAAQEEAMRLAAEQQRSECVEAVTGQIKALFVQANERAAEIIEAHKKAAAPIGIDLAYWQAKNSDVVGYLYSPGTVISYPIVQGRNNDYYLDHDIYGNPDINGCIMLEYLNASDFSDGNSIIYGHHMKAGTMLASISYYKDASFYPKHPYMYLYTPEQTYRLDLIAGYSCPANDEVFCTGLRADQIARFKGKSTFKTDLTDTSGPYVTLCTCSYEHENWRYVVVCKKVAI